MHRILQHLASLMPPDFFIEQTFLRVRSVTRHLCISHVRGGGVHGVRDFHGRRLDPD